MAERNTLLEIAEEVALVFEPLKFALESPQDFAGFMAQLGWSTPSVPPKILQLNSGVSGLISLVESEDLSPAAIPSLIGRITGLVKSILDLRNLTPADFPGVPDPNSFKNEFPKQLVDYLFVVYLMDKRPKAGTLFKTVGIVRETKINATGSRLAYLKKEIAWAQIGVFFTNPTALFTEAFKWGTDNFEALEWLQSIYRLGSAYGLQMQSAGLPATMLNSLNGAVADVTKVIPQQMKLIFLEDRHAAITYQVGLGFYTLPKTTVGPVTLPGFAILPFAGGGITQNINLSSNLKLLLEASGQIEGGIALMVRPNEITLRTGLDAGAGIAPPPGFMAKLGLEYGKAGDIPTIIFGGTNKSRVEFKKMGLKGGAELVLANDPNVMFELYLKGGRVVIKGEEGDALLQTLLPPEGIAGNFDLLLGWSSKNGLYFSGSGGLELAIPTHISLGPIEIQQITLALKAGSQGIPIEVGASFKGELGPLKLSVENVGVSLNFSFPANQQGNLGPVNLALGFKPPNGVGISIDAGAVSGGGFLRFDFEKEQYDGVLELTIAGFISAKAIGLITTKMPDGTKGFSLLVIITAEFNPAFQLGYGFTLMAVGGLLGLNRTVMLEPLRLGVRTGAVNSIMFPQNVVANAPRIISDLKTIFPPYPDKFLIGPMGKIGWGTPTLISLSLGIIIEIPGNIAILGVLKIALPEERLALVQIQVNFVGTIDFGKKLLTFDASLYESRILFMTLEGDMAVRLCWGDDPNFLISVGGFHPSFTPPPLELPALRRLSISIINTSVARVRCETYQAVTSNTVQFGARVEVFFGFSSFNVNGHVGFDALIRFNPFYFIIEISASFSLRVFGVDALSVRLRGSLEGPAPWRIRGTGSVSILFFDIDVDFDYTWGDQNNTTLPSITILPKLREELASPAQWQGLLPLTNKQAVTLRPPGTESKELLLHPSGTLVVNQKVLPLDYQVDKIGAEVPSDCRKVRILGAGAGFLANAIKDSFARAQFKNMTDAEKLSIPSFEKMDAGISIAPAGNPITTGKMVKRTIEYETTIIDIVPQPRKRLLKMDAGALMGHFLNGNSAALSKVSQFSKKQKMPFEEKVKTVAEPYVLVNKLNGQKMAGTQSFGSHAMAQQFLRQQVSADPAGAALFEAIPACEMAL